MPKETTRVDPADLLARLGEDHRVDATDDRILEVAAQLIVGEGLAGLEVDEVAGRSGVGRSTVYRRFGDRNTLIAAALAHEGRRLLTVLAAAVAAVDDLVDEVVVAFCAGLRLARASGLSELIRSDPLLLRLLTVEGDRVVAAARAQLTALALRRAPDLDVDDVAARSELLIRLAISFVLTPDSVLDLDGEGCEAAVRRHIGALVGPR